MDSFGLRPLPGGYSGETFVAGDGGERTVVRVYAQRGARRGGPAPAIDAAVLHLVRGLLPVPQVLEVRPAGAGMPGVLVTSFLPGERLDTCLPGLDDDARGRAGRSLGQVLARLAQMPMPRAGQFTDASLRIEPWDTGLEAWVELQRAQSALASWPAAEYQGLLSVAAAAQDLLDETDRVCLVHSDFNPKNLLIDRSGAVTGLLDWEFAHAGGPGTDLGNLLRFDREPLFAGAVLEGYLELAGHLDGLDGLAPAAARQRLLDRARAADLMALAELAGRRGANPVAGAADALLRAIAVSGDLHAVA